MQYRNCGEIIEIPVLDVRVLTASKRDPTWQIAETDTPIFDGMLCEVEGTIGRAYHRKGDGCVYFRPSDLNWVALLKRSMEGYAA